MNPQDVHRAKIEDAVRAILLNDWDPIGINDDPEWPKDEYDTYVREIAEFIARNEPVDFIARHLCFIESKLMGLSSPGEIARMSIANKLKGIHV